jgi:hypothetical protein
MYYAILIRCFPRSVTHSLRSFLFVILDLYTFIKLTVIITSCPRYTFLSSQLFISVSLVFCTPTFSVLLNSSAKSQNLLNMNGGSNRNLPSWATPRQESTIAVQRMNNLVGLSPSQISTIFVDCRLYRFQNTLSVFPKGLSLPQLRT